MCVCAPEQSYVQEGGGDGLSVMDQEGVVSRDMPTSPAESKRYNLRGFLPGLDAASSLSPPAGKTRHRKNPNPKVLVCTHTHAHKHTHTHTHHLCGGVWLCRLQATS